MGDALKRVVSRAISDAAFRRQLQQNPKAALREFNLSAAEVTALTSGDATKLTSLGIDQRMSRMFAVAEGSGSVSRFDTDASAMSSARIDDDAAAGGLGQFASRDVAEGSSQLGRIDSGADDGGLSSVDAGADDGGLSAIDSGVDDGGLSRIDITTGGSSGLSRFDIGTGTGPDGVDLERLAGEETGSTDVWSSETPYGVDRLDRMEGSTEPAPDAFDSDGGEISGGGGAPTQV